MAAKLICKHCGWRPVGWVGDWQSQRLLVSYLLRQGVSYADATAVMPACSICARGLTKDKRAKVG